MIRNVLGSIVALIGAAGAVVSPFRYWYDGRLGRDYRVSDLFTGTGITHAHSGVMVSILLPFIVAAVVTLAGVLLRSRLLVVTAGVIVLAFTVLWMVRQGQAAGSLSVGPDDSGLRTGVASAAAGGVLLLLGAALMSGRRAVRGRGAGHGRGGTGTADRQPEPYPGPDDPDVWPPTREPGPSMQTSPYPEPETDPYPWTEPEGPTGAAGAAGTTGAAGPAEPDRGPDDRRKPGGPDRV
ncbi:hypothetical protein ACPXCE_16605 [Streptomyces sp. DT24]|uniref:hypothetical protein n=1 Tax=Streptomyces sp. DT24 TaxID=3416520 RepID=UPI003CF31BA2